MKPLSIFMYPWKFLQYYIGKNALCKVSWPSRLLQAIVEINTSLWCCSSLDIQPSDMLQKTIPSLLLGCQKGTWHIPLIIRVLCCPWPALIDPLSVCLCLQPLVCFPWVSKQCRFYSTGTAYGWGHLGGLLRIHYSTACNSHALSSLRGMSILMEFG